MTTSHTIKKHIWLIGFSGSGKSTVGPMLAKALKMPFVDTDAMVSRSAGTPISRIFETSGEKYFRLLERKAVAKAATESRPTVIALGGGAFNSAFHRAVIRKRGAVVYLSANVPTIYKRLHNHTDRPMLNVIPKTRETRRTAQVRQISELLAKREKNYRRADITISTNAKTPAQIVKGIIAQLKALNA
jgi:shikimate kinase